MPTTFNPGEPVFDQTMGEPFIDPATGDFVEAAPGLQVDAGNGRTIDGDDVVNAGYYRVNHHQGESIRDRRIGVPYNRIVFEAGTSPALVGELIAAEYRTTPGIESVTRVVVDRFDRRTRILWLSFRLLKDDGSLLSASIAVAGS